MKLIAIADVSGERLEHILYWEMEESDYSLLEVSDECMRIVRELHDPIFLGKPMPTGKRFEEGSAMPVYYIPNKWPYKATPVSSIVNGKTGETTPAHKPDPDFVTWNANADRIDAWHGRLSRNLRTMCAMYWDDSFPKSNTNATYEAREGRLFMVGGKEPKRKEKEPVQEAPAPVPVKRQAAETTGNSDTGNPAEWTWNYSECPFPETMQQVDSMASPLKQRGKYKYGWDFGKFVIPPPSNVPSVARSVTAIKKYHLFAIARAMVLRSRGICFPWQYVYNSTKASTVSNSRIVRYRETMIRMSEEGTEADKDLIMSACNEILDYYKKYLAGNIQYTSKKFADATGQPWDIKHFVIELMENLHIQLKPLTKKN